MNRILGLLTGHGVLVLFVVVLVEQLGLPVPALPWILAAGALVANGQLHPLPLIAAILLACLIADTLWFWLGRRGGERILRLVCRVSWRPDSCVHHTRNLFDKYGLWGLVVAKFVPGLSTVIRPLAGMLGTGVAVFLLFDAAGSLLSGGSLLIVGAVFHHQLDQILTALAKLGNGGLIAMAGAVTAYLGVKYRKRRRFLRRLRLPRISADDLRRRQVAGEEILILDVRSRAELERDPFIIPGAKHVPVDELAQFEGDIPRDRDIVVYCSCPNEVSSATVASRLHREGLVRVKPLHGGFDAWRERDYPTERRSGRETTKRPKVLPAPARMPLDAAGAVSKGSSAVDLAELSGEPY